jgi:hypothetical protein
MTTSWQSRNGHAFAEDLGRVLQSAEVNEVEILYFARPHAFLGREISEEARSLARIARESHRQQGYGFWEKLLAISAESDRPTRRAIFDRAVTAQRSNDSTKREKLSTNILLGRLADGQYTNLPGREVVALSSRIGLERASTDMHLPMIDFALSANPHNDGVIVDVAEALHLQGSIFDSGNSYHYYGNIPITGDDLPGFVAKAQLLSPLVDFRWGCYQILDGEFSLRISTDQERNSSPHRLVASSL